MLTSLPSLLQYRATAGGNPRPGPPPTLPAPVPSNSQSQSASRILNTSQSFCGASNGIPSVVERRKQHKLQNGPQAAHVSSGSLFTEIHSKLFTIFLFPLTKESFNSFRQTTVHIDERWWQSNETRRGS